MSTPIFSKVVFEGDAGLWTEPSRFIFEHSGRPLEEDSRIVPEVAERFARKTTDVECDAVGINPACRGTSNGEARYGAADALIEGGKGMSFWGRLFHTEMHHLEVWGR